VDGFFDAGRASAADPIRGNQTLVAIHYGVVARDGRRQPARHSGQFSYPPPKVSIVRTDTCAHLIRVGGPLVSSLKCDHPAIICHILRLNRGEKPANFQNMSTVKEIESALARLPAQDLRAVRDWLDDFIEDQLEVSDGFKAKVQRAQAEMAEGAHSRVRRPEVVVGR